MPGTTVSERSSHHSPASAMPTPSWAPPRAPLPPHRLAKLANALGVSTPLPAVHSYGSSLSLSPPVPNSSVSASFPDHFRRSPTPSAASAQTFTSTASSSKYLLHVVPPVHLPHDSETLEEPDLLPPPPGASGYHTQFRRGVLVPVYPTLSSQLAAIAKEYALPSTMGLILYLVLSTSNSTSASSSDAQEFEEPGPRISDEIWRHIWLRVVRSEREDSLSVAPRPIGLGLAASSPSLLQDVPSPALRPLISPGRIEIPQSQLPMTPSPSTASHSVFSLQSEFEAPESMSSVSVGPDGNSDDLPLPGLNSPSLIPVLAKVEFDVDRRKAAWYDPWLRSRKVNHAKRAESRLGMRKRAESRARDEEEGEGASEGETRRAPIDLELVGRMNGSLGPSFLHPADVSADETEGGYAQLADEPEDEEGEVVDEDFTARIGVAGGDPLADVFGPDADTWANLHAEGQSHPAKRNSNPNIVDLALDGAALSTLPDNFEDDVIETNDEEEVTQLWNHHSRPSLVVSIPSPPSARKRQSSPTTAGTVTGRRHPPPPLDLAPSLPNGEGLAVQGSPQAPSSSGSVHLPYLEGETPPPTLVEGERGEPSLSYSEYGDEPSEGARTGRRMRSPEEEKRDGAFFEDLDLGLNLDEDTLEYDESDPHDRRRSQFIMKAQLDEIERNLIQLSPRRLQTETEVVVDSSPTRPMYSATLSPPQWGVPLTPLTPSVKTSPSPHESEPTLPEEGASWPAVPYSVLNGVNGHHPSESVSQSGSKSRPPSPPRIAFNGVTTEPPKGAFSRRSRATSISNESLARKRDEHELYPPLMPPVLTRHGGDSPVIPLSPDPFGRFPSEAEATRLTEERHISIYQDERPPLPQPVQRPPMSRKASLGPYDQFDPEDRPSSQTPSSRFSLDSITSEDGGKNSKGTSLVSMKSIKKLWRKTNSKLSMSGSSTPVLESGRSSPNYPNEQLANRRGSRSISKSPQPSELTPTDAAPGPLRPRRKGSIPSMQFMQDSRNSIVPMRTPPLEGSRQPSPALPPLPPATPSPSASPQMPSAAVAERNGNVRKSILKSWKSASGSLSAQTNSSSSSTPRSSSELLNDAPIRRRRPSLLDGSSSMKRGSMTSMSTTLVDIPPSPALPDEFAQAQAQARKRSSQSNLLTKRASTRQRPSPSMSSTSTASLSSSPPRPARLTPTGSPPKNVRLSRASGESSESRPSFDVSQFEIVSPKMDAHTLENTLSYPYHALDHSMTSME